MVDIPKHPFVQDLMAEPDGERRVALVGYAGPSNNPEKIRLYTDMTFGTYLEVASAAVIKTMPAKADDENSPNVVIVDAKTPIDRVTTERTSGDAAFLSGAISNAHYGAAQAMGGTGAPHAGCICLTFTAVNTLGQEAANVAAAGISGLGCTTVTAPPRTGFFCPPPVPRVETTFTLICTHFCTPAAQGAMGAGTIHTIFNCHPGLTMVVNCTVTAGLTCACAQAQPAAAQHYGAPPCHNITHTLATTCTMPVPGGGGGQPCWHVTLTAATLCTQAAAGAAQPNVGAQACLNLANTMVCTPTGVPFLCPAG